MKIVKLNQASLEQQRKESAPSVTALGFFDGLHLGHQRVIEVAKMEATKRGLSLACMSFAPHPKQVLGDMEEFPYLIPLDKKVQALRKLGVDIFYIVSFDKAFASLPPKQFVKNYLLDFQVKCAVAGFDFTYGHRGIGKINQMREDADGQMDVIRVDPVTYRGQEISSTIIRSCIENGQMSKVIHYLGEDYEVEGTINIEENKVHIQLDRDYLLPKEGHYVVHLTTDVLMWRQIVVVHDGDIQFPFSFIHADKLKTGMKIKMTWKTEILHSPHSLADNGVPLSAVL